MFTENYKIKKHYESNHIYTIEFEYTKISLINSIIKTRIIQGATVTDNYKTLQFKATKVSTYTQYKKYLLEKNGTTCLSLNDSQKMIISLVTQLEYLIKYENQVFLGYNTDDLLIINDTIFIYLGCDYLCDIKNIKDEIVVTMPFSPSDFFLSPELLEVKELPTYINFKTSYFSLGCLILCILLGNIDFYEEYIQSKTLDNIFQYNLRFKNTKLYHFLERCLKETPDKRTLIYL
jgi:serine/threonine protein kinase